MLSAVSVAIALALVSGCSTTPGTSSNTETAATSSPQEQDRYPLTIDDCGMGVTFTKAPQRVIAIKSTSIEMMMALGVDDRLVGVAFPDGPYAEQWSPAKAPTLLADKLPSQESVIGLDPDLVYAGWESNFSADGAGERETLQRLGVTTYVARTACTDPTYAASPLAWADIWAEIDLAGRIFDVPERAAVLVSDQKRRLAAVTPDRRELTALWYSSGSTTPYVGAGVGNPQLVMDAAGLRNIAANVDEPWSSMSWESIVAADPDVIVLVDSAWGSTAKKITQLESHPATANLTAVKQHRYLIVPFATGEAGVRSVEAVETLVAQLASLP
ncbi:putative F420-0 ABC transporter substrate-binding protein [Microbacterium sp. GXS0129]|uniref:putative F420-0 ABC transporter substrate-binding protein n=1 Tax=Microbacterium sp. GXS0129 TaxID=3377836 RepID=UPI00383B96D5